MNTQNVNVKTATPESPKTWAEGHGDALTPAQFRDLYDHLHTNAVFTGISGVDGAQLAELAELDALEEPTEEPEAAIIYLHKGWPLALYEYDTGYLIFREALAAL
ncbi:hypothetical protein BEE12_21875 (plasmid) [Pantoea agglomerans]|uniref:hypothetical protein n=1 Tax=Enterobacter agglomerans TaxID=549 RepID=UPI00083D5369|nr:hypothetical protein [Pantoea agglomerans]AOE42485.1 hypothetical protein BEE12_21875 [Pantoea agglomerans]